MYYNKKLSNTSSSISFSLSIILEYLWLQNHTQVTSLLHFIFMFYCQMLFCVIKNQMSLLLFQNLLLLLCFRITMESTSPIWYYVTYCCVLVELVVECTCTFMLDFPSLISVNRIIRFQSVCTSSPMDHNAYPSISQCLAIGFLTFHSMLSYLVYYLHVGYCTRVGSNHYMVVLLVGLAKWTGVTISWGVLSWCVSAGL